MKGMLLGLIAAASVLAQRAEFDVASVKPSAAVPLGQNININLGAIRHNELVLTNTTLSEMLRFAYHLVSDDQVAGPGWIKDREVRFDVVAKGPLDATREQLLEMLQTLLDERFEIAKHNEARVVAHYELVIAKGGLKIHPSKADAKDDLKYLRGRLASQSMPMSRFTMLLSRQLRQAVIDKTGLSGAYDIDIAWTPDEPNGAPPETPGPSIFTAIQDQLGLRLESHKSPIEVMVIDRADRVPIAN
jgi:uncharacterized protein (TIGR03435 family)